MADDSDDVVDRIYAHYFQVMHYTKLIDVIEPVLSEMMDKFTYDCTSHDNESLRIAIEALELFKEDVTKEVNELLELTKTSNTFSVIEADMEDVKNLFEDLEIEITDCKNLLSLRTEWLNRVKESVIQYGKSEVLGCSEVKKFLPDDIDSLFPDDDQNPKELPVKPDDEQENKDSIPLTDQENKDSKDLSDSEDERANKKMRTLADIYESSSTDQIETRMEKMKVEEQEEE